MKPLPGADKKEKNNNLCAYHLEPEEKKSYVLLS